MEGMVLTIADMSRIAQLVAESERRKGEQATTQGVIPQPAFEPALTPPHSLKEGQASHAGGLKVSSTIAQSQVVCLVGVVIVVRT